MVLYRATDDGNIPMTEEEEAQIRADWAMAEAISAIEETKPPEKTLEERVTALEVKLGVK